MDYGSEFGGYKKLQRRDPKWLVSFADLMSLLFAMFVLLLSMADFKKDAFSETAGPIAQAFDAKAPKVSIMPHPGVQGPSLPMTIPETSEDVEADDPPPAQTPQAMAIDVAAHLRFVMAQELERQMVEVVDRDNLVVVRFMDRAAFAPAERELKPDILPAIDNIIAVLSKYPGRIRIEGHTDNIPINTGMFRSNWDLSAARAASVVHYLLKTGAITPARVSAEGFADSRPLESNDTAEGRARNRRVEISIELMPDAMKK